jgi:hypothetical protein
LSKALYGAEIFDVGTWPAQTGPVTVTLEDIDSIVASFEALGLSRKVPLKAGHNEQQPMTDGQPALGWVSRIWRQGSKLMADFVDMPTVIHEAIRTKRYKTVSVELLRNVQAGTRKIPWVLDAVSLLGADQPAVGTLKDLEVLTMSRKTALRASARVAFRREFHFTNSEARKGMEKHEVEAAIAAALSAQEVKFTSQLNALKTESAAALAAEQEKTRKAEIARHRDAIKSKFEAAVNKTIIPATRERFYKLTRIEDDTAVMAIKLEDADEYIKDNADKALMSKSAPQTQQGDGKVEHAATNDLEVSRLSAKDAVARGFKANDFGALVESTKIVLKANPKLAKAYIADPTGEFKVEAA